MAFNADPFAMVAAKSKAQAAAEALNGEGARYKTAADALWSGTSASRGPGSTGAYGSGGSAVQNLVPSTLRLPQGNQERQQALYASAGSSALKGLFSGATSAMPAQFDAQMGVGQQGIDAGSALAHQEAMNEWEIEKSKLGGGSVFQAALPGILSGVTGFAGAAKAGGWFSGGGGGASAGSSYQPYSASNPNPYSTGFTVPAGFNPWG